MIQTETNGAKYVQNKARELESFRVRSKCFSRFAFDNILISFLYIYKYDDPVILHCQGFENYGGLKHICPKSTTIFPRVYILLPRVTHVTRVTA